MLFEALGHRFYVPVGIIVGVPLIAYCLIVGRTYFGFPGDGAIERRYEPKAYWFFISLYTAICFGLSYLELRYGPWE
jgi:hypothetical protein